MISDLSTIIRITANVQALLPDEGGSAAATCWPVSCPYTFSFTYPYTMARRGGHALPKGCDCGLDRSGRLNTLSLETGPCARVLLVFIVVVYAYVYRFAGYVYGLSSNDAPQERRVSGVSLKGLVSVHLFPSNESLSQQCSKNNNHDACNLVERMHLLPP